MAASLLSQQLAGARGQAAPARAECESGLALVVYGAATGAMVEIQGMRGADTVRTLQERIARPAGQGGLGVDVANQILLCTANTIPRGGAADADRAEGGGRGASAADDSGSAAGGDAENSNGPASSTWMHVPTASLQTFDLPSPKLAVYMYDRRNLSRRSTAPPDITVSANCVPIPDKLADVKDIVAAYERESRSPAGTVSQASSMSGATLASLQATMLQFELSLRQGSVCVFNFAAR